MARARERDLARAVLDSCKRIYAQEAGIRLEDTRSPRFEQLAASLLLSARIPVGNAVEAARTPIGAKLTTPREMAEASWPDRADVITWHDYERYDERTATVLGQTAERRLERYGGDLRKLPEEADRNVDGRVGEAAEEIGLPAGGRAGEAGRPLGPPGHRPRRARRRAGRGEGESRRLIHR